MLWFNYSAKCVLTMLPPCDAHLYTLALLPPLAQFSWLAAVYLFYLHFTLCSSFGTASLYSLRCRLFIHFLFTVSLFCLWKVWLYYLFCCCISRHLAVSMFACKSTLSQVKNDGKKKNAETMRPLESTRSTAANKTFPKSSDHCSWSAANQGSEEWWPPVPC